MRIEMVAVSLSFTGLVALFGYITNEAVKFIENARKKRKALSRLSSASVRMCPPHLYPNPTIPDRSEMS